MIENKVNGRNRKQTCQGWYRALSFLLVFSFLFLSAHAVYGQDAKHIILMIADGRGPQHNTAKNDYTGTIPTYQSDSQWIPYWMSTFPYGGSYDATQAWTNFNYVATGATDSAASASAIYSGSKTNIGRANVSYDGSERFYTIGEKAKSLGKGTGVVTTVPISDATPGVFCAHNDSRANTYAIADECLFGDPNTTGTIASDPKYDGGHGSTLPTIDVIIGDGRYGYVNDAIRNKLTLESGQPGKHVFVKRETGIDGGDALWSAANNPAALKLAGLFDHIYRHDPSYSTENPTLAESALAALAVLQKNPNGFLLVVEGGAVDWASHSNNMDLMVGELIDFDEAVDAVIDWVNTNDPTWANTLVIVTSDHETGYLTPRPGIFQDQPLGEVSDSTLDLEKIITNSGGRRASWLDADRDSVIDSGELVYWAWNSGVHTNTLIPLYARGIGADLFDWYATSYDHVRGAYLDNTNIFSVTMAKISGNNSPRATITSITPNPAMAGETVTFTGSGEDLDGTITAYEWTSSINGMLSASTSNTYSTSSLSAGTHTISLRVKDDDEAWSTPVTSSLTITGSSEYQVTLEATYSTDVNNAGRKYYHDGSDWVGRGSSGPLRVASRWDISGIDPSWDIVSVEVRFYTESAKGSTGALSINRYGTFHGQDNPETDTGTQVYSKSAGTPYAPLPEPSSGSWTPWINLGSTAVSDIIWCRDGGFATWSVGLKASDAIESSTAINHVDFSEDNEANDAELRITYTATTPSNQPPTATDDSASTIQSSAVIINVVANDIDPDGTIDPSSVAISDTAAYGAAISKGDGTVMYTPNTGFTGTDTFTYTVKDNDGATSNEATVTVTVNPSSGNQPPTATITSITPNPAMAGETVTFTGSGEDLDGTITAYEWTSSINGMLSASTSNTYSTSSLSAGTHTISLRVKDDDEAWSTPVTSSLTITGSSEYQVTLEATYSTDVNNAGRKYYHDGSDWVGRGSSGPLRVASRWDISGIDPSWDIVSVEVRFYTESAKGSTGALSINRYGTFHGQDNPETDTGTQVYSKSAGTPYAPLPEPSSGSWTPWINLGSTAVSDIIWCRDGGFATWSVGLKASDAIESSTAINHVDFSEDNEANDAELRITYTATTPSNQPPTATITSITPNPAMAGETVTFTGSGEDLDGTITAYEWTSSINGMLSASTSNTYSTSSLSAGTHTISLRVKDDDEAWSTPVTSSLTITGSSEYQVTLEATYSTDVNNAGRKYYHDGSDWVGRGSSGPLRVASRWDISGIDPSWDIVSVEVRFYTESAKGSTGALSINRYGTFHGQDNPETDTGTQVYSKSAGTPYAPLPEPSSGSWTPWINLGSTAVSDIIWCRDGGFATWSVGLKASDAIESSTAINHVDFSEDNEANDAELRITYTL